MAGERAADGEQRRAGSAEVEQAALGAADREDRAAGGRAAERGRGVLADGDVRRAVAVDVAGGGHDRHLAERRRGRERRGADERHQRAGRDVLGRGVGLAGQHVDAAVVAAHGVGVVAVGRVGQQRDVVAAVAVEVADAGRPGSRDGRTRARSGATIR